MSEYMTSQLCPRCVRAWDEAGHSADDVDQLPTRMEHMRQLSLEPKFPEGDALHDKEQAFRREVRRTQNAKKHQREKKRRERNRKRGKPEPSRGTWRKRWIGESVARAPAQSERDLRRKKEAEEVRPICAEVYALLRGEDVMGSEKSGIRRVLNKHGGRLVRATKRIRVLRCKAHRTQDAHSPEGYVESVLYHRDGVGAENTETSFLHANAHGGEPHPLFRARTWNGARKVLRERGDAAVSRAKRKRSASDGGELPENRGRRPAKRGRVSGAPDGQAVARLASWLLREFEFEIGEKGKVVADLTVARQAKRSSAVSQSPLQF